VCHFSSILFTYFTCCREVEVLADPKGKQVMEAHMIRNTVNQVEVKRQYGGGGGGPS
jgi:carbamate kinase